MFRMSMREFRKITASYKRHGGKFVKPNRDPQSGANNTEKAFNFYILGGIGRFHPKPFVVSRVSSRRYTADYRYEYEGVPVIVEVKGSYRLPSEGRARLAWELAAEQNHGSVFVWARNVRSTMWEIEAWYRGGKTTSRAICYNTADFHKLLQGVLA